MDTAPMPPPEPGFPRERMRGQNLPHNVGAEQSVLGCAMMKLEPLAAMLANLGKEDFFEARHQLIFDAIASLNENQKPCDILTVTNQLVANGMIGRVGGRDYVASLPGFVPFVDNYPVYIDLVRD
ncbi:MAG TPA: DnaB-like helicase N-terminal domain-containing protein, partial [Clostridia bacterium]|nr:DnaB-like helicase N-terminal domain-containing protein [Clostridia bacterium]